MIRKEYPLSAYLREYEQPLGRLKGNLLGLEFVLRFFLYDAEAGSGLANLTTLKVGEWVPLNPVTDFANLRCLIQRYNRSVMPTAKELCIDEDLVRLRDALAHGRLFSTEPAGPFQLVKFSDRKGNHVKVEFSETVTVEWLEEQVQRTYDAILKVLDAHARLRKGDLKAPHQT